MSVDPQAAKAIFMTALDKPDPAERSAYLAEACNGDEMLRQRVEVLLKAHSDPGSFLQSPAAAPPAPLAGEGPAGRNGATLDEPIAERSGTVIGPYKLIEQIGEGGMGTVWMAQQTEPIKRLVAVKLIKAGMDSKQVIARFEAERQALALMDHANIARIFDGGVVGQASSLPDQRQAGSLPHVGRPYFVMELVKGMPITKYCDEHHLTPRQRLELFITVCQAVQHAHQKGIIHRDLKPSNVLVALYDGKPVPKVIDFGVAKAAGQSLTDKTLITGFGNIVGTLEYMSPEQAEVNQFDIDTRSDIYSLGVLLYELLTGTPPFSRKELEKAGMLEMLRVIREQEPSKPSTKLSTAEGLPTLAANRGMEPAKLTELVRGELDWIVMKALEKDRNRRYETANGFAMDVQRYLADEAVQACPPSSWYRLRKFVRRNKGPVLAAVLVVLTLVAGMFGTTWGMMRAQQARRAEAERAEGERLAREESQKRLEQIQKGNEILTSIFQNLDPRAEEKDGRPLHVLLSERLDQAVRQLEGEVTGDPLTVARLQDQLGVSLLGLGYPDKAIVLLEQARDRRREQLGHDHAKTLSSMHNLADAYRAAGNLDLALPLHQETVKLMKAKLGVDHSLTLTSMVGLAQDYQAAGKLHLALPLLEETLKLRRAKLGTNHFDTLQSMNNLADAYQAAGKRDLALLLFEETLKLVKAKLGPDHPHKLIIMYNLADAYRAAGKLDLALPLLEETLKLRTAKLGPDHPHTLKSMNSLAQGYQAVRKLDLALPLFEETVKLMKAKLGPEHPTTLTSMNNLASAYLDAHKLDLALPLLEQVLAASKAKLGSDHSDTLGSMNNLARAYQAVGKLDLALPLHEETLKLAKAKLGPEHPNTLASMGNLGGAYCDADQGEKAAATLKEFVARRRMRAKPDDPQFAGLLAQVALELLKCRQHAAGEEMLRECLAIREKKEPDAWTTFNTKSMLGGALLGQKEYAEAELVLIQGYEGLKQPEPKIPQEVRTVRLVEGLERLVQLYDACGKKDEAAKWRKELEAKKKEPGDRDQESAKKSKATASDP